MNLDTVIEFIFAAFTVGKGMVAGGAALGLGSLCFYGLASKEISALDKRA